MVENGLYIIKQDYFDMIKGVGADIEDSDASRRPVYCCIKDRTTPGIYWAIPTSDWSHRSKAQQQKYMDYISKPESDLRHSYYHIAYTTKKAVYKISSCFPITESYVDHEFLSQGKHVVLKSKKEVEGIEKKLRKILAFESRKNNYFSQHITDIKNVLMKEMNSDNAEENNTSHGGEE